MNQELIIKSITIIGAIFLIIIIAYIIVLLKNHFFKSIKRNKKSRLTNKKKIFKKQKKSNPLANTPLSIQRTTRIESVHKPELNTQTPAVTIRKNKIMNTLQEEEIMKQKVLEKYMESYTTEGRKSILKSKIQKEEESKIYKEDQIQKVRNELLTGKEAHAEKTVPEKYDF